MKRGPLDPREVVDGKLTENEKKVFAAWATPSKTGKFRNIREIAEATGFTTHTVLRHLATIEKWLDAETSKEEEERTGEK